jgi:hypothetical protein
MGLHVVLIRIRNADLDNKQMKQHINKYKTAINATKVEECQEIVKVKIIANIEI